MHTITERQLANIILEELTRSDVRTIIDSELDSYPSNTKFKKEVRTIVVDVLEDFFKEMWRKNGFWKGALKR